MSRAERISAVIVAVSGVLVAAYSYYTLKLGMVISPGAGFMPFLLGIAFIILGVIWFFQKNMGQGEVCAPLMDDACVSSEGPAESIEHVAGIPRKMLLGMAAMIVYGVLFERVGYFLATLIFMLGWQRLVEQEKWLKSLLITSVATMAMYVLSTYLLGVFLPKGTWLP